MRIFVGHKGNIDFDAPVKMTTTQQEDFISFMKSMFSVVDVHPSDEVRTDRIGDKLFMREWTADEYKVTLQAKGLETICEELGRTWMSVDIKLGSYIPQFLDWCDKNNKDHVKGDVKAYIEEFMKEKEDEIIQRRKKKQAQNRYIKNLKRRRDSCNNLIEMYKLRQSVKIVVEGDENRPQIWYDEIADIEAELKDLQP